MRKRFALVPIAILGAFSVFTVLSVPTETLVPILFYISMIWILAFAAFLFFLRILPHKLSKASK